MKLSLQNIGKVKSAEINIEGITVIAGENNTGKSTVGKTLYSIFTGFKNNEQRINLEIKRTLRNTFNEVSELLFPDEAWTELFGWEEDISQKFFDHFKDKITKSTIEKDDIKKEIFNILENYHYKIERNLDDVITDDLIDRVYKILNIPKETIINSLVYRVFSTVFNNNTVNVNSNEGIINLNIKNKDIKIVFSVQNESTEILNNNEINIYTDVIYIDNPFILDKILDTRRTSIFDRYNILPESNLSHKLRTIINDRIVDEILAKEKLDNILNNLNNIVNGEFQYSAGRLKYKDDNLKKEIDVKSLSAGLKTFSILKILLLNGSIKENGTIILDEPEIHLHPEWQIIFAELIVLLQKEFNLHILLTTHSPYFLNAIDIFTKKYNISKKCNYYLASNEDNYSVFKNVTEDLEQIYKIMAKPFQDLEDIKFE